MAYPTISSVVPGSTRVILTSGKARAAAVTRISPSKGCSFVIPPIKGVIVTVGVMAGKGGCAARLRAGSFANGGRCACRLGVSRGAPKVVATRS